MVAFANAIGVEGARAIFGAIIGAGIVSMIIAAGGKIRFFPPVVTGTIITIIGVSLMRVGDKGWRWAGRPTWRSATDVPKLLEMVDKAKPPPAASAPVALRSTIDSPNYGALDHLASPPSCWSSCCW